MTAGLFISPSSASKRATPPSFDRVTGADGAAGKTPAPVSEPSAEARARAAYGRIEMSFEENRGQADEQVKFLARGAGYTLFLTPAEAVFVLARQSDARAEAGRGGQLRKAGAAGSAPEAAPSEPPAVLRMKLEGANQQPAVSGLDELEGKVNYFIGDDAAKWHTNIPTFGRVRYEGVYEGVDAVYYGNQRQLEYDFVVAPGADYGQIALAFEGADKVEQDAATGDLLLEVGGATLRQHKPFVYQEVDGERREVQSGYVMKGAGRVGFAVGEYDARRPLVIDPALAYSIHLGGNGSDIAYGCRTSSTLTP